MGNPIARKMKRTRMQEIRLAEEANRGGINNLHQNLQQLAQHQIGIGHAITDLQKNVLGLVNVLKERGIVTDLMIHSAIRDIEEFERMKKSALIIDPNKPTVEVKPEEVKP